jgi:hypothetical protein
MGNAPNVGRKRGILFLLKLAHNMDLWTNDKVIEHTYFGHLVYIQQHLHCWTTAFCEQGRRGRLMKGEMDAHAP